MRVIIAGTRNGIQRQHVDAAMRYAETHHAIVPTVVLSGRARGGDRMGEEWAAGHGVPVELHAADWARYPRNAGMMRNVEMAHQAHALVAVWDGVSNGTRHMIEVAERCRLRVVVWRVL